MTSAREVLADFMNQGHLTYLTVGRASDNDRADAMIRDLAAEGLMLVSRADFDAMSEAAQHRSDLSALMRQMLYRHSKGLPLDERLAAAADYLSRKKLHGSILRDEGISKQAVQDKP